MKVRTLVMMAAILAGGAAQAETPDVDALLKPCAACHGADGISSAAHIPHLNGQLASYLRDDLSALVQARRKTLVVNHIPATWGIAEIKAVARFYETRQAQRPPQPVDAHKVVLGEVIYQRRCAECHPDSGRASEFDSPLLAAQNIPYLVNEMRLFVTGERKFVYKMDEAFRGLSMQDLEAVAHFFASQPQH